MKLTEHQKMWLKKATAQDLARAYVKKGWDYKTYKEIEGAWNKIHKKGQQKLSEKWFHPDGWR